MSIIILYYAELTSGIDIFVPALYNNIDDKNFNWGDDI